jgi:hypothetical protein
MTLHILRDPCAYLCLDHSLACSDLASLLGRVQTALERRDRGLGYRLPPVSDPAKWRAWEEGTPEDPPASSNGFRVEVRRTGRRLIIGRL